MKIKSLFSNFRGDLFGGLTAGIVALPLALAFGVQSGLGATAGLYGAILIGFFASLFGGTPTQISGPTAPMTATSMVIIGGIIAANDGNVEAALPAILTVFLLAGLIQILLGFIKVGAYIKYIPYPVVSGFMTGIGVIILLTQILPAVGYYPKEDLALVQEFKPEAEEVILEKILKDEAKEDLLVLEDFEETINRAGKITNDEIQLEAQTLVGKDSSKVIGALKYFPRALQNINWIEFMLAMGTIIIIYGFKRITTAVPSSLVALVVMTMVAVFGGLDYRSIQDIPFGFPPLQVGIFSNFNLGSITPYLLTAVGLALLGVIDSLLTSVVADNLTRTKHKPNQELIGQGIGNSVAALFGGIPGAGATIRTVVNINAGGKSKLSGMIAALLLLAILLALGPIASKVPKAVLAGILITVGIGVMDYKGLGHIRKVPLSEAFVMIVVLLLTVFWDLIFAVGIGLVLSSILFMKKISDVTDDKTEVSPIKDFSSEVPWADEGNILAEIGNKIYIKHLDGPLFFGFTSKFGELVKSISEDVKIVVMRMDRVPYIDQSGLYAMEDAIRDLEKGQGKTVVFTGLQGQPLEMFESMHIIPDQIEPEHLFEDFRSCAQWLRKQL